MENSISLKNDTNPNSNKIIISHRNINPRKNIQSINSNSEMNISNDILELVFCPNCLLDLSKIDEFKDMKLFQDNKLILCKFCEKSFFTVKCYHCKRRHFFRENCIIDGINIKCQYLDCGKYFSRSCCAECQKNLYYPDKYLEGTIVKCPFKECEKIFSKILCPNNNCKTIINFKNGLLSKDISYREGLFVNCKDENCNAENFAKMNCLHCSRRLVWFYPKNILEGQKIICPHEDCGMSFNKIYCPHCNKCNLYKKGLLEIGAKITCIYKECGKSFNKIFCPHCFKTNIFLNGNYIEGIKTTCVYNSCAKNFQMLTCANCKRINIWKNANYLIGQNIICAYADCGSCFSKISCPHCNRINIFSDSNNNFYTFGKTYKCIFPDCRKEFANFVCPDCKSGLNLSSAYQGGNKVICGVKDCKASFYNFKCPFCFGTIFDLGAKYKFGQSLKCPFESCLKIFNYNICMKCKKGIFHKQNDYKEGQQIQCPYKECGESFVSVYCTHCERICQYKSENKKLKIGNFECLYSSCKKNFEPANIHEYVFENTIKFIPEQGIGLKLDKPEKEYNEMNVLDVLTESRKFYYLQNINRFEDGEFNIEKFEGLNLNKHHSNKCDQRAISKNLVVPMTGILVKIFYYMRLLENLKSYCINI